MRLTKDLWAKVRNRTPTSFRALLAFILLAGVLVLSGYLVLRDSVDPDLAQTEMGKWLFTAATAVVVAGGLSTVLKELDARRAERAAWEAELIQLVQANQSLRTAARMIRTYPDGDTFREQMREVMSVRSELRAVLDRPHICREPSIKLSVTEMRNYVTELCSEHEKRVGLGKRTGPGPHDWRTEEDRWMRSFLERGDGDLDYRKAYRIATERMRVRARMSTRLSPELQPGTDTVTIPADASNTDHLAERS